MIPGRNILVDDVRIRGIGRTQVHVEQTIAQASSEPVPDMVRVCRLLLLLLCLPVYQSKHICVAPYVANESEALYNGRD